MYSTTLIYLAALVFGAAFLFSEFFVYFLVLNEVRYLIIRILDNHQYLI